MKFTKQIVAALTLPEGKREQFEWDASMPGFGVRLRQSGPNRTSATWVIQSRFNGNTYRESLGDVRKVTLDDARKAARHRFAQIELGIDPRAQIGRRRAHKLPCHSRPCVVAEAIRGQERRAAAEHPQPSKDAPDALLEAAGEQAT